MSQLSPDYPIYKTPCDHIPEMMVVPCRAYDYDQLAKIYSDARIDYIVPMPMNGTRMRQYVEHYDADLDASVVAVCSGKNAGIGMLGVRGERGWITRLGIRPQFRRCKLAHFIVEQLVDNARAKGLSMMQIEIIVGNDAAYNLFEKFGFIFTRQLLVIRRPPGKPIENTRYEAVTCSPIPEDNIPQYLERREPGASWVEETRSLLNGGSLEGIQIEMPNGDTGWIVFQKSPFQLRHFVFSQDISQAAGEALLYQVHKKYAGQDTNIENVPVHDKTWAIFQSAGYFESFRRNEMVLQLRR